MKDVTDPKEIEEMKREQFESRRSEQDEKNDYRYLENGEIEKCDDCGNFINGHGHCPRCDY